MKNKMKKCLAIAVAVVMIAGSASAFASDGGVIPSSGAKAVEGVMPAAMTDSGLDIVSKDGATGILDMSDTSKVKTIKADTNYAATINYDSDYDGLTNYLVNASYDANSSGCYDTYPVTVKATGKLSFYLYPADSNTATVRAAIGTLSGDVFNIKKYIDLTPDNMAYAFAGLDVTAGTEYAIGFSSTSAGSVLMAPYVIPYSTRTLAAGKKMVASGVKGSSNADSGAMFKIVPTKSGYIDVYLKAMGLSTTTGKVTLLNSSKKAVSSALSFNDSSKTGYVVFGVKKGRTYYLKVNGCKGTSDEAYAYEITYKATTGKIRSNTKKSKAVTLKRKASATKTTIAAPGKSSKDWYKFKVTKKRVTKVRVDATNVKSGSMKITVYCGKKKVAAWRPRTNKLTSVA